jgi:prolyl-tRNA synthetase
MKGVPVRLGIGKRDLENGVVEVARRDTLTKENVPLEGIADYIENLLNDIQDNLLNRSKQFRSEHITKVDTWEEFQSVLEEKGGFISAHWDGTTETELKIKEATKATLRCIPLDNELEDGQCVFSGKPSKQRVLFAKAY